MINLGMVLQDIKSFFVKSAAKFTLGAAMCFLGTSYAAGTAMAELPAAEFSVDPAQQALNQIMSMMEQERASLTALGIDRLAEMSGMGVHRPTVAEEQTQPATLFGLSLEGRAQEDANASLFSLAGQLSNNDVNLDDEASVAFNKSVLDAMPDATGGPQWKCLTEALYFEARSESLAGQFAVGEVILNRVDARTYPNTVCGVVTQGAHRLNSCQFSYNCDGKAEHFTEDQAFARSGKLARMMLDGTARVLTDGATHYHANSVSPGWSRRLTRTAQIGHHTFYRQ